MAAVMKARASIIEALDRNPLGAVLEDICGSHADPRAPFAYTTPSLRRWTGGMPLPQGWPPSIETAGRGRDPGGTVLPARKPLRASRVSASQPIGAPSAAANITTTTGV